MTARSKARKRALDILFESDVRGVDALETLDAWVMRADPPVQPYARTLVVGVHANQPRTDEMLSRHLRGWTLDRLPPVDRTVLRLATYELVFGDDDVPPAVVIDEAVELAKSLSTDDSPAFVNGVLARILDERAAARTADPPPAAE